MFEYTFLVIISLVIVLIIDIFILKTKLFLQKNTYFFLGIVTVLQTIVDNYLNGRWWLESYIVGPYNQNQYSGINIIETPLENYFFGYALLMLNVILFEYFLSKKTNKRLPD
jgi:lycopene cyclase domain-containing protein